MLSTLGYASPIFHFPAARSTPIHRPAQLALINQNRQEYGDRYAALAFPSTGAASL